MRHGALGLLTAIIAGCSTPGDSEVWWVAGERPVTDDETVVLFDGSSWSRWRTREGDPSPWEVQADGSVLVTQHDAVTDAEFGDFQLHLEFLCPPMGEREGQARANSGVYLHGRYEVQVLDSYGLAPAGNGCGAVYSIAAPLVNASRPAGEWQSYDIVFRAPRYDGAGTMVETPRLTVIHNGVVIHNNLVMPKATPGGLDMEMPQRGPILLQDHGDPIRYRNIWLREL
jgi:hypothetical protein